MIPASGLRDARSTFSRLFTYSKDSLFSAHENFTTEALAACIRADAQPMLAALRALAGQKLAITAPVAQATWIRVQTQLFLPEGGFLDMVLTLGNDAGVVGEVWVEAKIESPEGVGQLPGYARAARAQTEEDGVPRDVVALSKEPLDPDFSWLDWRKLYAAAARSDNPWWQDLCAYMEETQVSDAGMLPITDREAGSIADSARMLAKVSQVIQQVHRHACKLWPDPPLRSRVQWGSEGALLNHLAAVFRQRGRMMVEGSTLRYGAVEFDGIAYWVLAVRARGQHSARLEQLVSRARARGLGPDWEPQIDAEEFVSRTVRVASHNEHEQAVAWFDEGLQQLHASGLISELGGGPTDAVFAEPEVP